MLTGSPAETAAPVRRLLAAHPDLRCLWVSRRNEPAALSPRQLLRQLGSTVDLVVLDLHDELPVDAIAAAQGFLRRGGRLVLRRGSQLPRDPRLALWPHTPAEVGTRLAAHLFATLAPGATPLAPPPAAPPTCATPEQDRAVHVILDHVHGGPARTVLLLAPRGRGKSATLGRVARELAPNQRLVLCAADPGGAAELQRFSGPMPLLSPRELVESDPCWDVIAVDEAARIPVLWLQQLVQRHPEAHLLFATTTTGYEGTGRGFVLRFVQWLKQQARATLELRPTVPIRWDAADPLEASLDQALHLHARPAPASAVHTDTDNTPAHNTLSQDQLAADPVLLREVFGLLVHAHYRTRPADLHTLLDAPNLVVHVLRLGGRCVAVNLLAREGALPPARCQALAAGRGRLRGHALADTLITHGGCPRAGALTMLRSVRIATHPALRRRGLGRQLADAVHAHHAPALFGTLFGATPALLGFRRAQGYRLVRLGAAHGTTTGSPSAVMVRPESGPAHDIVEELRAELARNLPHQLRLLQADASVALDPALAAALEEGLPPAVPLSVGAARSRLAGWLDGPRTSDAVIAALRTVVHHTGLDGLSPSDRALVTTRVLDLESWRTAAEAAGLPTVRAAQRQLKRAVGRLLPTP